MMAPAKPRLSPMEQEILQLLTGHTARNKTDSVTLAERFYRGNGPDNAVQVIVNTVRALETKTKRAPLRVMRGHQRRGPYPMEIWIERQ